MQRLRCDQTEGVTGVTRSNKWLKKHTMVNYSFQVTRDSLYQLGVENMDISEYE